MTFKTIVKAAEPKTFTASVLPVLYGGAYAFYKQGSVNWKDLILIVIGMMLVQGATNMINDYYDHKREREPSGKADEKVLASGELTQGGLKKLILAFSLTALAIGIYFALTIHLGIFAVIGLAILGLFLYSAGPLPVAYTPFGELLSGFMMGILVVMTVIFIETGLVSWETFLVSLPSFFCVGLLLLSNNLSDWQEDLKNGRKTLVILLGGAKASWLWPAVVLMAITSVWLGFFFGAFEGPFGWVVPLLVTLAIPLKTMKTIYHAEKARRQKGLLMKSASQVGIRVHVVLMVSLVLLRGIFGQ